MSQFSNQLYEFGAFRLDATERVLWRGGEMLVLPPKVFDTLWILVKEEGRVVSKSELMQAIWMDATVEEGNLSQNIYTLRRTLGLDEQGRQFIETVPRRGYRFAVPVTLLGEVSNDQVKQAETVVRNNLPKHSNGESFENMFTENVERTKVPSTFGEEEKAIRPRSASRFALFVGLAVLFVFALGFGVYQFVLRHGEKEGTKIAPIEQVRFRRLTDSGDVDSPTISPSGELLAYVRHEEREESVWIKQIATGRSVQTLPPSRKGYRSLAFSPDGRYLYFRDGANPGTIYRTSPYGGASRKLAENVWSDFSVSPDGKQFAFIRRDAGRDVRYLVLSNIDGSGERELSTSEPKLAFVSNAPAWSPDGAKIGIAAGDAKFLIVSIATGEETKLKTPSWRTIFNALWMPNGNHLIISARATDEPFSQLWILDYPDGKAHRLTNDLEPYLWVSLSADGRMLVTRQRRNILYLSLLPDGNMKKATQLTFGGHNMDGFSGLAWTPEGKIVFSSLADNFTDIYSMNANGSNRVQLTATAGEANNHPAISRDGRYIVFTSDRSGKAQIWRMDIDGRNQKQLTFQGERAQFPALSPNGAEVFFIKYGTGPSTIWKVPIEGGAAVPVSHLTNASTEGYLSISPDGKWLAYRHISAWPESRSEELTLRIGVLPTDGNAEPKLFDLPTRRVVTQWSSDSTGFDYAAGAFNSSSLWRQPLAGGEPQKLCDFPDRIFNFAWSRDGKNLVVSLGKEQGDAILITNLP